MIIVIGFSIMMSSLIPERNSENTIKNVSDLYSVYLIHGHRLILNLVSQNLNQNYLVYLLISNLKPKQHVMCVAMHCCCLSLSLLLFSLRCFCFVLMTTLVHIII